VLLLLLPNTAVAAGAAGAAAVPLSDDCFLFFSLVLTSARTEVLVSCIRGCGAVIKRCALAEHMKGECLHESVPCPLGGGCGALVMRKDLDRHCAEKEHETSLVKEVT
jgi:hypothetical protein